MENNKLNIYKEALAVRKLNIIEKATVINRLLNDFRLPPEKVIKEYLPLLQIPAHKRYLQNYTWLHKLSDDLKTIIKERDIDIDIPLKTKEWPAAIREEALSLIFSFQLGKNKTMELVTLLNELSLPDRQKIRKILTGTEWLTINKNPNLSPPQKGMKLREILQAKRFPIYKKYEKKLKQLISALELPASLTLNTKEILTLEKDCLKFSFDCHSSKEIKKTAKLLSQLADKDELQQLLRTLQQTI